MKSGYRIKWSDHALEELQDTYPYLEQHWTDQQLQALSTAVEQKIKLISQNPYLFQVSNEHPEVRRAVVIKLNSIYFRIKEDQVEILSFYANRKDPEDRKL